MDNDELIFTEDIELDSVPDDEPTEELIEPEESISEEPAPPLELTPPEPVKKTRKPRAKKDGITAGDITKPPTEKVKRAAKAKKPPKIKPPKDIRFKFHLGLAELDIEKLKKPWMAEKSFRLITDPDELQAWADGILADSSRHHTFNDETCPVVAVDTETTGLDTRILVDMEEQPDGSFLPIFEVKIDISGICLSADGIEGIYIPITHEIGDNMDRAACTRVLQYLFDRSHLAFYNAKYDREVLRLCMGIEMRPYPHFEDVQVLVYINDPKADLGDKGKKKGYTGSSGGLKGMSKTVLGIEQIELDELTKVKAEYCPVKGGFFGCNCSDVEKKERKHNLKVAYAPFSWVPTDAALWYAAGDAITTWLLWEKMHPLARTRQRVHVIDHELIDSLTWIERQRFHIDTDRLARTTRGHASRMSEMEVNLRALALNDGYIELSDDEGNVSEEDKFNPGSTKQLQKLFFEVKKWKPTKWTDEGNISCDKEAVEDLHKLHPEDKFLTQLLNYRDYAALHPGNLRYDPKDSSARMFLKACVVAGGRLSGAGGKFEEDGGFGLNPQGIKKVESHLMWKVTGNILKPDAIPAEEVEPHTPEELHPSCRKEVEEEIEVGGVKEKHKVAKTAPGIINNHIGQYMGYAVCLVPTCTTCADKFGILIPNGKIDANEVVNLRCLFDAEEGFTFFCCDYSNIEVRACADVTGEPELIKIFLEGDGDHHALTASKIFPEYNDPSTSASRRKYLRGLGKVINFVLQYAGTAYSIYEGMKKENPDITWEECDRMVSAYWAGVPVYKGWCDRKQFTAKHEKLCTTVTGRVINFQSAMETLHLHEPTKDEMEMYWKYRGFNKDAEAAKKSGDIDKHEDCKAKADQLWKDPETGVRNAMEHSKFIGKIQRVAVNIPLQGLAGDFMRMALNRIRKWALKNPGIAQVFRLHGSVHDDIDFTVKNEYAPFILPRVVRLMKLRKFFAARKWPVPIECDAEYGLSWDVTHHLTGDKDHAPAAWQGIKGCEKYIPDLEAFSVDVVKGLIADIRSGDADRTKSADSYMRINLHPRSHVAVDYALKAKDPKDVVKFVKTALQLHEYWVLDETPDGDEANMETLEQYEKRRGLTVANRGFAPSIGYLGAIPLTEKVRRPAVPVLGPQIVLEVVDPLGEITETPTAEPEPPLANLFADRFDKDFTKEKEQELLTLAASATTSVVIPSEHSVQAAESAIEDLKLSMEMTAEETKEMAAYVSNEMSFPADEVKVIEQVDDDIFAPMPRYTAHTPEPEPVAVIDDGIPEVRHLDDQSAAFRFKNSLGLGLGKNTLVFRYKGVVITAKNTPLTAILDDYLMCK